MRRIGRRERVVPDSINHVTEVRPEDQTGAGRNGGGVVMDDGVAVEGVRGGCRNETTQLLARIGGPGGVPAHFKPALEHPQILENLAHQIGRAHV